LKLYFLHFFALVLMIGGLLADICCASCVVLFWSFFLPRAFLFCVTLGFVPLPPILWSPPFGIALFSLGVPVSADDFSFNAFHLAILASTFALFQVGFLFITLSALAANEPGRLLGFGVCPGSAPLIGLFLTPAGGTLNFLALLCRALASFCSSCFNNF